MTLVWLKHELRTRDHDALASAGSDDVVGVHVVDFDEPLGPARRARLLASARALASDTGGVTIREGDPASALPALAEDVNAGRVVTTGSRDPWGRERDERVAAALEESGRRLDVVGDAYAVPPGTVRKDDGAPYAVFTPFYRQWSDAAAGVRPVDTDPQWADAPESDDVTLDYPEDMAIPEAGEAAALERWSLVLDEIVEDYDWARDRPDRDGTSRMSIPLAAGEVHPRTLLADLAEFGSGHAGAAALVRELAFREFYADVLWHNPATVWEYYRPEFAHMQYDDPGEDFEAWKAGETGFPIVDAGMRQLLSEGWMHNRVRMVVASFLVKDLHIEWQHGARHFLEYLLDADVASNQHNWQWVAGCGTDAAPYFRVFNPDTQAKKFDPQGVYADRYLPDLRYEPIVDHGEERAEALRRYDALRDR